MPESNLHKLSVLGQSVWIDYLSRDMLATGELARMMDEDAVVGVTSNPTIFQKAISQGERYDEQLKQILDTGETDAKEIFLKLSSGDVSDALDILRPIWDESSGLDGYVSWEVDPTLAFDRDGTTAEAKRLHEWIDKPNLYVKIPATQPGLGSIEDMIAAGKNINVTLIFSLERHKEVMEAYIHGVERLVEAGGDPATVHSVASFFVSRVDTETDKRLDAIGGHDELKGKLGIANAKVAYQNYRELFSGPRWEALATKGATKQRCLWASTSTKNPDYRDVMYVEGLIGPETVNTMPEETIRAFQDHGKVAETLTQGVDEARKLLDDLAKAGVDYGDVVLTLEQEGVQKFADSFDELLEGIREKRGELAPA
ncbi:MAG: transaldolase [Gaiellaceae bacterium]